MKILLSFALIFVFVCFGFGQTKPKPALEKPLMTGTLATGKVIDVEAVKILVRGIELYTNGENKLAIVEFNKVIEQYPEFAPAYSRRGAAYANSGDHERAITDFKRAIILQPNFTIAYMNLAGSHTALKKYGEVIVDYSKLIDLQPDMSLWYGLRADAYDKIGKTKLAAADRRKEREINKKP